MQFSRLMKNQSLRPQRNREKLLVYNSITSLVGQIASVICGVSWHKTLESFYGTMVKYLFFSYFYMQITTIWNRIFARAVACRSLKS